MLLFAVWEGALVEGRTGEEVGARTLYAVNNE